MIKKGRLEGKVCLITGGTSGIGEAILQKFISEGVTKIAFTGRRSDLGSALSKQTGALYIQCDHTDRSDCIRAVDTVLNTFGALHVLVNNAGTVMLKDSTETTEEEWRKVFSLNVDAVWRMSVLALEAFKKKSKK